MRSVIEIVDDVSVIAESEAVSFVFLQRTLRYGVAGLYFWDACTTSAACELISIAEVAVLLVGYVVTVDVTVTNGRRYGVGEDVAAGAVNLVGAVFAVYGFVTALFDEDCLLHLRALEETWSVRNFWVGRRGES